MSRHRVKVFFPTFFDVFHVSQEFDTAPVDVGPFLVKKTILIFLHQLVLIVYGNQLNLIL
jgi:hypothetical protein